MRVWTHRFGRRSTAVAVAVMFAAGLAAAPAVQGAGDVPHLLFAGEMAGATPYGHVIVLYDTRLDETVPVPAGDFMITINGSPHVAESGSYLLSGLVGILSPTGSTFIRLELPAPFTIGPSDTISVTYLGHGAPLRSLALEPAVNETFAGEVLDPGPFDFLGAVVDSGNAANRLTLLFYGQVDLSSIPEPDDFVVTVNGPTVGVSAVEPRVTDIGMGIVDLVLAAPVHNGDALDFTYTPDTDPDALLLRGRGGGPVLGTFGQTSVLIDLPPATASTVLPPEGGSLFTGDGGSATVLDPLITTVISPVGGPVSIDETPTVAAPAGYTFFGEQVTISAPVAISDSAPLVLVFDIDKSLVPEGQTALSVVVLRNGTPVAKCDGPAGSAIPPTCVANREDTTGGGIRITVNTVAASRWNFATVVPYSFGGFRSPVDGPPTRNLAKAGTAIPVRFSLGGDRGMAIFTTGSPASQRVTCDTGSPLDTVEETVSAGASSLKFDPGNGLYSYVWKTDSSWAGTCRSLLLSFGNGIQQTATFQFK